MFGFGPSVPSMSTQEVQARLNEPQPPMVLDVREPEEYREGHIPGSTLIPLGTLGENLDALPKSEPIIVVCRSGGRSAHATQHLVQAGYQAINMVGGMLDWRGPVER